MSQTKSPNTDAFPKGMSQPALRALHAEGYATLEDVAGSSKNDLLALHGFGPKSVPLLESALEQEGLEPLKP